MSMERKYKFQFNELEMQSSVTYTLVSRFDIEPNILKAEMDDSGGVLILKLKGEEENLEKAIVHVRSLGISVMELSKHITRDHDRCIDCGSCVAVCPSKAFTIDRESWEVHLNFEKCVACGSCLTSCPTHAISLTI